MTNKELILLNLEEIRRRSIMLWKALPEEHCHWRPDNDAMTAIDVVRHVLGADHGWDMIINHKDMSDYRSLWEGKAYTTVTEDIAYATQFRDKLIDTINGFSENDIATVLVTHPGNNKQRSLGDYLLRIGYHESVHAGQFLSYLRGMGAERPSVWD